MTPDGWGAVESATNAAKAARERAQAGSQPRLMVSERRPKAIVRFLQQGGEEHPDRKILAYYVHPYKDPSRVDPRSGRVIEQRFTCLNWEDNGTECPGCKAGMKRKLRVIFSVIERDRDQLRRGADGYAVKDANDQYIIDGQADEVVLYDVASTVAEVLRNKDSAYKGLMSRDVAVRYTGVSLQINDFEPADLDAGATPLSEADLALIREAKVDRRKYIAPPEPAEAQRIINQFGPNSASYGGGGGGGGGQQQSGNGPTQQQVDANPFLGELS